MTTTRTSVWEVGGLRAGYGSRQVLFDLSFALRAAEVLCLLGHNGAGKSTLLKALAGQLPAEAKRFAYMGNDAQGMPIPERLKRGLVYMPEGKGVFQNVSVADNLWLGLAAAGVPRAEREGRIDEVLEPLPVLKRFYRRRAGLMSGGQQQMLSLARALSLRPRCLLLDEPSIGLAPRLFQDLMALVRSVQQAQGFSLLLVEQNVAEALAIADRVIVMKGGAITFTGVPADLDTHDRLMELY